MPDDVVSKLSIEINSTATKANTAIDTLITKVDKLNSAVSKIDASRLNGLANGVSRLSTAMKGMSGTADFTRLVNNLEKIGNIKTQNVQKAASAMNQLSRGLGTINNVGTATQGITELANSIAKLGYKSTSQAITNLPILTKELNNLINTLSRAPKVSKNIVDLINSITAFTAKGSSAGTASKSLARAFDSIYVSGMRTSKMGNLVSTTLARIRSSMDGTSKSAGGLAVALGKFYATYWMLIRAAGLFRKSIDISSQLTEIQNVIDVTFGDAKNVIEDFAATSREMYGMSELTSKKIASRFQAMGVAMGFTQGKMASMSTELTALAADMASFYDVEQAVVAEDLEAIFTGMTRPLKLAA